MAANLNVQLGFMTLEEREVVMKMPTNAELIKAGVPEYIVFEHTSMDLATWAHGIWKCDQEHFRPINEDFQPKNRPT